MKRVMIVGQPGGGKSTLARILGEKLGLPVVHIDLIHWMPGWVERDPKDRIAMLRAEEAKERWVIEGGLSATHDTRLARADCLIVLQIPFLLRVWRVFFRTLRDYGRSRPDLPENCPERFDPEFWTWIWNTRKRNRDYNIRLAKRARDMGKRVVVLRSRAEVSEFVKTLDAAAI